MTRFGKFIFGVVLIVVLSVIVFFLQREPALVVDNAPINNAQNEVLGNKDDLVSFSILPGAKVQGLLPYRGTIKGAYFFEGNILINILDLDKRVLKANNAMAITEWMTSGPVDFEGKIDFNLFPKGPAYLEIHNDNASGLPENDKSILIPIIIE